jgi:hypothetical protein
MSEATKFEAGDRVVHAKMPQWGIAQVKEISPPYIVLNFENGGEKRLKLAMADLRKVHGAEAESAVLDSRFKPRRKSARSKIAPELAARLYKEGKSTSRKDFIESLGATCANWYWSWSFVNEEEKKIIFGQWRDAIEGNRALIFTDDWQRKKDGTKRASWPESRENIRKIEEDGYSLQVFTMINDPEAQVDPEERTAKILAFFKDLSTAELIREGGNWYAVVPTDS